ncbi:hypothetical protein C942_02514 [Photobacterium marinum]|uniref:Uncharacterized protein n=1 Tax=Photobacterium marinum TaxID=1056511 RepID=L8J6K4_9GAMM|nr:hypothetical protein C942_02514 [Photobacterium marinum]
MPITSGIMLGFELLFCASVTITFIWRGMILNLWKIKHLQ